MQNVSRSVEKKKKCWVRMDFSCMPVRVRRGEDYVLPCKPLGEQTTASARGL